MFYLINYAFQHKMISNLNLSNATDSSHRKNPRLLMVFTAKGTCNLLRMTKITNITEESV